MALGALRAYGTASQPAGAARARAGHDTSALQAYLGHKNIQHMVRYTELTLPV